MASQSYWLERARPPGIAVDRDLTADVVIVGGGITGLTTAYLLALGGARVVVLERSRLATADTGHTTAHLTQVTDSRLHELKSRLGPEGARAFWAAGQAAVEQIATIAAHESIECGFRRVTGYLHEAADGSAPDLRGLERDQEVALELGLDAAWTDPVPVMGRVGIAFPKQAKFHPVRYLAGLADRITALGGALYEQSAVEGFDEDPLALRVNGHRVRGDCVGLATHNPLMGLQSAAGATLFQTKLALYSSYVLRVRLEGDLPEALYWDTADPYRYVRIDREPDATYAIVGGEDVKTGQEDPRKSPYDRLEAFARRVLPVRAITHRWMGQVIETDDGLPFIGENVPRQFIATGFAGNGMTLGTVAALMARDYVEGRKSPWSELFDPQRSPVRHGLLRYLSENIDYPLYFTRDRLKPVLRSAEDLAPGEGALVRVEGRTAAAFRQASGELRLLSPVCTHMKCHVHWNTFDGTWDCPCHGSRFAADGQVLSGPAESPLEPLHGPPAGA